MHGNELAQLAAFLAVARHLNFRKAASERNVASSAISHAVRGLEERVGVRLFHRTTRNVSLTEAGERFLSELGPAFDQIDKALDGLNSYRGTPFGTVRISVPNSIAPFMLKNVMGPLIRKNPGLRLDIEATDRLVDIVKEGYDAGVRFGERISQDMVAVRIQPRLRFSVVGSPEYFAGRSIPAEPADLQQHSCIRYRYPSGAIFNWLFERNGEELHVEVDGPVTLDDQYLMVEAALQGCGLAFVWEDWAEPHIASGALIRCLDDWCAPDDGLQLYYPSRHYVSAGLRSLIEMLRAPRSANGQT